MFGRPAKQNYNQTIFSLHLIRSKPTTKFQIAALSLEDFTILSKIMILVLEQLRYRLGLHSEDSDLDSSERTLTWIQ